MRTSHSTATMYVAVSGILTQGLDVQLVQSAVLKEKRRAEIIRDWRGHIIRETLLLIRNLRPLITKKSFAIRNRPPYR